MRIDKIGFVILIFFATGIFWGCSDQAPPVSNNSPSPTSNQVDIKDTVVADVTPVPTSESSTPSQISPTSSEEVDPLVILVADEITTLDPYQFAGTHPEDSIAGHLWDTLTRLNDDLEIEPAVAESWRLVNNFTWEFKLRRDITFHNGEPLNTEAVRFSIERARSAPGSLETFADDVELDKVEPVDDYTLRLTTKSPVFNLPYHLAFLEILPPLYYTENSPAQVAAAPMGSGPYQVEKWSPGEPIVLKAVSSYWRGAPAFPEIIFKTIPLAAERMAALRLGEADLITNLSPGEVDQWNIPNSRVETTESTQRIFVGIHIVEGSPLADKRVRQALNYGVNVQQIIDDLLAGYGEPYGSWANPPANNPELKPWPYDPDQARDLLAQAGYRTGFTTTLRTPAGAYYQDVAIAQAIAQQLSQIGITVEVESVEWTTHVHDLLAGKTPPLFLLALNSSGDGLEDTKNLSANFPFNPTDWQNESFEETLRRAYATSNEDSRARLLGEAQALAYDEAPWIWLWRQYLFYGVNQDLDWAPRRDGVVDLYRPVVVPSE